MNTANGKNQRDQLREQSIFQRRLIFSQIALCGAMALGWGWTVLHSKVIVTPPEVKRRYEVGSNFGSSDYLVDMTGYALQLLYTNSPDSVEHNNGVLLKMSDPESYWQMKTLLDAAAIRMKTLKVSTVWTPTKETVSEKDLRVTASGRLKTYIADVLTSNVPKEFLVEFTINSSGRLYVHDVQEVVKPDRARPAGR